MQEHYCYRHKGRGLEMEVQTQCCYGNDNKAPKAPAHSVLQQLKYFEIHHPHWKAKMGLTDLSAVFEFAAAACENRTYQPP